MPQRTVAIRARYLNCFSVERTVSFFKRGSASSHCPFPARSMARSRGVALDADDAFAEACEKAGAATMNSQVASTNTKRGNLGENSMESSTDGKPNPPDSCQYKSTTWVTSFESIAKSSGSLLAPN